MLYGKVLEAGYEFVPADEFVPAGMRELNFTVPYASKRTSLCSLSGNLSLTIPLG
jgi:hypothetical protein